jgi:hypothetical protein
MPHTFRTEEAAERNFNRAAEYLIGRNLPQNMRANSLAALQDLTERYGPVVDRYPSWHPFVRSIDGKYPETMPNERTGFRGIDHLVMFTNAFISCPYSASSNPQKTENSVASLKRHHAAYISTEPIDAAFYSEEATPVLVVCNWKSHLDYTNEIPKPIAVPLMIEEQLRAWENSKFAEQWETMRPYILGTPHGARSSLFVNQDTGLALKKVYLSMVNSGMFGPLRFD